MTVTQTRTVDWLAVARDSQYILLAVVDHLDWADEQNHLVLLQDKLNTYLSFIESGEVFDRVIEVAGVRLPATTPVRVRIYGKFVPPPRSRSFIDYATEAFRRAGFSLEFRLSTSAKDEV